MVRGDAHAFSCKRNVREVVERDGGGVRSYLRGRRRGNLVQDVYRYLAGRQYLPHCTDLRKRAIRRKSITFVIHDGELFFYRCRRKLGMAQRYAQIYFSSSLPAKLIVIEEVIDSWTLCFPRCNYQERHERHGIS